MRRRVGILLLLGFIAIAVFGFIAIGHLHESAAHGDCIAAISQGVRGCADEGESATSLLFHLRTFKSYSQALLVSILALSVLITFALLRLVPVQSASLLISSRGLDLRPVAMIVKIYGRSRAHIVYWLSLLEARDKYARNWVHDMLIL